MSLTKCPYCAEEIQADEIKCKHCDSWLTGDPVYGPAGVPPGAMAPAAPQRLVRSTTDKMLAGICGGVANYIGLDSTVLRILVAIIVVFTGFIPGIITYVILSFIIPRDDALPY